MLGSVEHETSFNSDYINIYEFKFSFELSIIKVITLLRVVYR